MEEESELFDDVQGLTVHAAIGYFIASYSSVELALTALLSALVKATDYNAFHTLTKGLDGRAKVQRFKELCKQKNLFPENSALKMRLDLYDTKITNLRNLVAHCMIIIQDDGVPTIRLSNFATITGESLSKMDKTTVEELHACTDWCDNFHSDLIALLPAARSASTLTIKSPHSLAPKEFHSLLDDVAHRASLERQRQMQRRKNKG